MLLKDYLNSKENKRRILIVSDLSKGNALLRKHEAMTGNPVHNVTCMTLTQTANQIWVYMQAESGYTKQVRILDGTEAMMLFRSVIFNNQEKLRYFNDENMMDFVMTEELFQKANLVRGNGWNGAEEEIDSARIADLKLLISEYEKCLAAENQMDTLGLYRYVIAELEDRKELSAQLWDIFGAEIAYLVEETERFSGVQKTFLELLVNGEGKRVELSETNPTPETLTACKAKAEFFKGYGSFNEANYVVNDMMEKGLSFGSAEVMYSSASQLPALSAALRGNGIPMRVVSDRSAADNPYLAMTKRILEWAGDDFSEKALEAVLACPVACVMIADENGEERNALGGRSYFDHVLVARNRREQSFTLGWGYERNLEFVAHEKAQENGEKRLPLLDMHTALLDIFGENGSVCSETNKVQPMKVYRKLVSFIERYTVKGSEYAVGIEELRRMAEAAEFETRSMSLSEVLEFIEGLLETASVKDGESADAVTVRCLGDWSVSERPNVYVIGLSLKDMQGNTTESPVLSDEEIETFLGIGFKPTVKRKAELREKNFYRTLQSFSGERIVFGYSSYDTVGFCENNPSGCFRDLLQAFGGGSVKNLKEFVYGNPEEGTLGDCKIDIAPRTGCEIKEQTSNSAMEVLLDCPKKYAYTKELYIPENEYTESNYAAWLDSRLRGSFFHEIMEKYARAKLIKPEPEAYDGTADEELIMQIAEEIKTKMLAEMPVAFPALAESETKQLVEAAKLYVQMLQGELNVTGWRVLAAEQSFLDAVYKVNDYTGTEYNFTFSGIIDRIDYRVDKSLKEIHLRIADYKTGRRSSKERDARLGKVLQHAVYRKALMVNGNCKDEQGNERLLSEEVREKVARLSSLEDKASYKLVFDCFQYEFPMEPAGTPPLTIQEAELEGCNLTRLRAILTVMEEKKYYPDHAEFYKELMSYKEQYSTTDSRLSELVNRMSKEEGVLSPEETSHCRYCEYKDLCGKGKAVV